MKIDLGPWFFGVGVVAIVLGMTMARETPPPKDNEKPVVGDTPACRYTINGDNTLNDNETGLQWTQYPITSNVTQAGAASACSGLNLGGTGWRLPRIEEYLTIVDETRFNPGFDQAYFPASAYNGSLWSATEVVGSGGANYFQISVYDGRTTTLMSNFAGTCFCVR